MSRITPPNRVAGPVRRPVPFGLFSVVAFETPDDPHWQTGGVTWEWIRPTVHSLGVPDSESATIEGAPKVFEPDSGDEDFDGITEQAGFTVYGHFKVSAAWDEARAQQRALEHLLAGEERAAEYELLQGIRSTSILSNAVVLPSGTPAGAVSALEQYLADTYASQGILHMSRDVASGLLQTEILEVRGGMLVTRLGTPVVAGSGYNNEAMVCTSAMIGYRSEVFTSTRAGSPLIDVRNNDRYAVAERTYLIGFDPVGNALVNLS